MLTQAMLEGLPPNGAAWIARLVCDGPRARAIADLAVEHFDPAEAAASAFEIDPNAASFAAQDWLVEIYFAEEPDADSLRALVAAAAGDAAAQALTIGPLPQQDWVRAALDGLAPVRAGRFVVHGAHDRGRVGPPALALEIEAALAFGTGHHGTTRGCLILLDRILARRRPWRVLDVGTGTGVLAMAAARALKQPVAAGDIDPVAVAAAAANARLNRVHPWVRPVVARGLDHPALAAAGRHDLIVANILAAPLRRLAPAIARAASPQADIVLSGLLLSDAPGVLSAYGAQGFRLAERIALDGWATLRLRRGGAAARRRR